MERIKEISIDVLMAEDSRRVKESSRNNTGTNNMGRNVNTYHIKSICIGVTGYMG